MWRVLESLVVSVLLLGVRCYPAKEGAEDALHCGNTDCGEVLFLTPLLKENNIERARALSMVTPDILGVRSYSGYFTVNEECQSHLFFWFFPAQEDWENSPVLLWLQGGPGASSIFGLFEEIGPLTYIKGAVRRRIYPWNVDNNLLIIDQPAGAGFSVTEHECYPSNEDEVSKELYSAVQQFHKLFPLLRQRKFFIAGESYAGHFVPALGLAIHKGNLVSEEKINLNAMMIGNGLVDVLYQTDYADYLYNLGLIDEAGKKAFSWHRERLVSLIEEKEWKKGYRERQDTLDLFDKYTHDVSLFNYLKMKDNVSHRPWIDFITLPRNRKALHVGNKTFTLIKNEIITSLLEDSIRPMKTTVEELINHYPMVFYYGQLDVIDAYPMGSRLLRSFEWSGAEGFKDAVRQKWCVGTEVAGYYRTYNNLNEVLVRSSGHIVPKDQPLWAFRLVQSVTSGSPLGPLGELTPCPQQSE